MKNTILFLALIAIGFTACTSTPSTNTTSDSTVVDSTVVDSIIFQKVDSIYLQNHAISDSTSGALNLSTTLGLY